MRSNDKTYEIQLLKLCTLYAVFSYCMLLPSYKCGFNNIEGIYSLSPINDTIISAVMPNEICSLPIRHEVLSHFIIHVEKR